MGQYAVICRTDPYHAAQNARFKKHETEYVVSTHDTLKEANTALLGYLNEEMGYKRFPNWGLACACKNIDAGSHDDGTKYYESDVYTYRTEKI